MATTSRGIFPDIFPDYIFELGDVVDWIKEQQIKLLALQCPEGIKRQVFRLMTELERRLELVTILLADPCFGACDLVNNKLRSIDVDGILHFGHSEITNVLSNTSGIPTKFIELQLNPEVMTIFKDGTFIELIRSRIETNAKIGLLASVQYLNIMQKIKGILERENYAIEIAAVGTGTRIKHPGQVLGCNFMAATNIQDKVSVFLFIGDGDFHPLGISLATNKLVFSYDPLTNSVENMESKRNAILKQRMGTVSIVKTAMEFGILVSTKPGQNRFKLAQEIKRKLKDHQKYGIIICLENIKAELINYLPVDVFINTACPRLAVDDHSLFKKPIITPIELELALGEREWDHYEFDEIL